MVCVFRVSFPGYVDRVEPIGLSDNCQQRSQTRDVADEESLTVEDDTRPVDRRSTGSPRRKAFITDLCFVHHFLHAPPYLIIDGIKIWAARRPQCRIYEVRSFIRQKCNRFSSFVRWSTILLENVKLREFSNFR